jgi:activator of HSP90 ATPase
MAIEFEVSALIPASPEVVYEAWLDSEGHAKMTGGEAKVSSEVGGEFEAWDGYIQGRNLELEYGKRIVQSWRTAEFADDEADSRIEIIFDREGDETKVTLRHTNLPPHGEQYEQGWVDSYFVPMKEYFESAG